MAESVPEVRRRLCNAAPVRPEGAYVLYWMIGARRTRANFALQWAADWAERLQIPLLVFEPLRVGYRWASDRFHAFVLQGMRDNAQALASTPVGYFPYVEPEPDADKGLLLRLARDAALVVTDEQPGFFQTRMVASIAPRLPVRLEAVDSCGLLPLQAADREFTRAHSFRRFLQKTLPSHLLDFPRLDPLQGRRLPPFPGLPSEIESQWPRASEALLACDPTAIGHLAIDHAVGLVATQGGAIAARRRLDAFLREDLAGYAEGRNHPDEDRSSRLSPYLHFGHLGAHEVFEALTRSCDWTVDRLGTVAHGGREGWWGMPIAHESFLDELVTWRELGYVECGRTEDFDAYESLPEWARRTLAQHAADRRSHVYSLAEFESACTHDAIWNAAQRELVSTGRMHNYLRMLWGKKILEWTPSPQDALAVMVQLNNRWALDGRDPNSYSGIHWVLGKYDRAWGPERPIFGKIRFMSSDSTRKKLKIRGYLERFGTAGQPLTLPGL